MRLYKIANTENYDGPFLVELRANIDNLKPVIYTSELSFVKIQKLLDYGFIYSKDDSKDGLEIIFDIDSNKFLSGYEPDNETITCGQIKFLGSTVKLVDNWNDIKLGVMTECVNQKFAQQPYRDLLLATGDQFLQEGNNWGDLIWGVDIETGEGQNLLGKLIMEFRETLIMEFRETL